MTTPFNNKFQKTAIHFGNLKQKLIIRAWGLAKRLDPRTQKGERKKPKS